MPEDLIPMSLIEVRELLFNPCNFQITNVVQEPESTDYSAHKLEINGLKILFRVAKITPTKVGQFVTLWKRIEKGPIQPYDFTDAIDFVVINAKTECHLGQFVFPKSALLQRGIFSTVSKEGKRAIRVYPSWDKTESKQAQASQKWQLEYFLDIPFDKPIDVGKAKLLYNCK
nr:MepB family protein [uncultured Flavobacterium sp.]